MLVGLSLAAIVSLYLWHLPLTVTLEDSGHLLMVAGSFGVAHPPGYPLFGMIGGLFSWLPTGNLALNVHLMSLTFGALSLFMVFRIAKEITGQPMAAAFGMAMAALAPSVMWYFTVAEVYSLFTVLFLSCFYLAFTGRHRVWLFFLMGLGLCAHWPLFVLAGPALLLARPRLVVEIRVKHVLALLLGLTPFIFLWLRSRTGEPYLMLGKMDGWREILDLILRRAYRETDHAPAVGFEDEAYFFANTCHLLMRNSAWFGALFSLAGLWHWFRHGRARAAAAVFWIIISSTFIIRVFLKVKFDVLFAEELESFHVLPMLAMGIAAAGGVEMLGRRLRVKPLRALLAASVVGALLIHSIRYERKHNFASEVMKFYLSLAPDNAVFLAHGDSDMGPAAYMSLVEKVRPDVRVLSQRGFLIQPARGVRAAEFWPLFTAELRRSIQENRRIVAIRLHAEVRASLAAEGFVVLPQRGPLLEIAMGPAGERVGPSIQDQAAFQNILDRVASGEVSSLRWNYYREALMGPLCLYATAHFPTHPILDATIYCRYFSLKMIPPADAAEAARRAENLWRDVRFFQDDERAIIKSVVDRHWRGAD